jgi:CheY-like chemotaxis protein
LSHVLVIGDEPGIWEVTRSALTPEGYRVSRAFSVDAFARLRLDQPDLAIVDTALRQPSAAEVASEARRCAIPVLLTSDKQALDARLAALGIPCLRRPFPERELLEQSRRLIAEARARQGLLQASLKQMKRRVEELRGVIEQARRTMNRLGGGRGAPGTAASVFRADTILREALDYWQRKRGAQAMARRRDIDPAELPFWLLPHLELIEVTADARFRYRLVGTAIVGAFGAELTGKYVDEAPIGDASEFARTFCRMVCEVRKPIFARHRCVTTKGSSLIANRLLLPLSEDGRAVSTIAGAATFELARSLPRAGTPASHVEIVG